MMHVLCVYQRNVFPFDWNRFGIYLTFDWNVKEVFRCFVCREAQKVRIELKFGLHAFEQKKLLLYWTIDTVPTIPHSHIRWWFKYIYFQWIWLGSFNFVQLRNFKINSFLSDFPSFTRWWFSLLRNAYPILKCFMRRKGVQTYWIPY